MPIGVAARWALALGTPLLAAGALAGCGGAGNAGRSGLRVVAAESVWGSIARELAGGRAEVRSVVASPGADPHSYEPTAADARLLANARLVIVNGLGYDGWAGRLLAANPVRGRIVLDVGELLGLRQGDNPHQWYSPPSVRRVAAAIAAAYRRLEPAAAASFARSRRLFETRRLARYDALLRQIRSRFHGVAVGYGESVFEPLGASLGLRLLTPAGFPKAVAEGSEIGAGDRLTVDRQVERRLIRVWVYDSQNETPDVRHVNGLARGHGIPVVAFTETPTPAGASFERWQVRQLTRLLHALERGAAP